MKKTLFSLVIFLFIISFVVADGGYFPSPGYWVRPGQQRAVIFHEDNTQTMILTSSFMGNAKDLVWIVPTPTKPEVTKASEKVFTNIAELARVRYDRGLDFGNVMYAASAKQDYAGVTVIESKQVDYYDVNVLLATNTQDLVKWFNDNNYSYSEAYSYVLKSYIDKGWYFTAIKVSPGSQAATEVLQDMKEGNPTPIKMVFLTDKIVFPLKISSVDFPNTETKKYGPAKDEPIGATRKDNLGNIWTKVYNDSNGGNWKTSNFKYEGTTWGDSLIDEQPGGIKYNEYNDRYYYRYSSYTPIYIYIISNGKYEADGFYAQYGNWVKKSQIEKLGYDDNGNSFIQPKKSKYFLTYLSASYQKSQMDEDITFIKSDDNKKVNAGPEFYQLLIYGLIIGLVVFVVWTFTPIGIIFIVGMLLLFLAKSNGARALGWVLNIISMAITFILGLIILMVASFNGSLSNYMVISLLLTCILLLGMMTLFITLATKYKKE